MEFIHDPHLLPQNLGIATESRLPESITNDHRRLRRGIGILPEPFTKNRPQAKYFRIIGRNTFHPGRKTQPAQFQRIAGVHDGRRVDGVQAVANREILPGRAEGSPFTADGHNPVRARHGQPAEVEAIEKAEERCVHAQRKRQAKHRRERVPQTAAHPAQRAAEIGADAGKRAAMERKAHCQTTQYLSPIPKSAASAHVERLAQIARHGIAVAPAYQAAQERFREFRRFRHAGPPTCDRIQPSTPITPPRLPAEA